MPVPLALIVPAVKMAIGGMQSLAAKKRLGELKRPVRTVSPAVQEGVARSRYLSQAGRRPGSKEAREQITTGQAGAVSQIQKAGGTSATTMAAAIGAHKQAGRASLQESILDEQFRSKMNTQYLRQLQNMAQEQQMNFQWNQAQKFQEEAGAAKALGGAGLQNIMGGVTEGVGMGIAGQLMGGGQNQASPFWNQKMGYMGTAEQYQGNQAANVAQYQQQLKGPQAPAVSNPMYGQFGEGITTTEGYMNSWMPPQQKLLPIPMGPQ